MTLSALKFEPEDLYEIEVQQEDLLISRGRILNTHKDLHGIAYSFRWDGILICIVGGSMMWEGTAGLWSVVNSGAKGHARSLRKAINYLLLDAAKHLKIRRYNIIVNDGVSIHKKWAAFLGFRQEGVMYKAAPDRNNMVHYVKWMEAPDGVII